MSRILLTSLVGILVFLSQIWTSWPDKNAHLITCDVGQGDAILITSGFNQMLIDGGRGDKVLSCLEEHLPFWDRTIEVVMATHADADHIGGLDEVLERYEVKTIISSPFVKDTSTFNDFQKAVEQELSEGAVFKKPILGQKIRFSQGGCSSNKIKQDQNQLIEFSILSPQAEQLQPTLNDDLKTEGLLSDSEQIFGVTTDEEINHNDLSIVVFLEMGQVKALLTGDLESQGELALINSNLLDDVDILKIGHHGAKTSTSTELLEQVRPETSLVSVGENNTYGHPSPEVIDNLMHFDSEILRTDKLGTIELVSDGDRYWLADEKLFSF